MLDGVHIRFCGHDCWRFRPYGGSLFFKRRNAGPAKSNQKTLAPAYGLRCAQVPSLRRPSGGIDSGWLRFDLHTMSSTTSRGAARLSPDEHLHSASRWGGWIKIKSQSCAMRDLPVDANSCSRCRACEAAIDPEGGAGILKPLEDLRSYRSLAGSAAATGIEVLVSSSTGCHEYAGQARPAGRNRHAARWRWHGRFA
ncbi:hypothetical protein ACVWWS_005197 [Pseudomonas chlororaphis]